MANLTIDINGKCTLDCEFCYQDLDGSQLTLDKVLAKVQAGINNYEFDIVEIGGGNPFLYKDLPELLTRLSELDKKAHIATEGTFIPHRLLELEDRIRENTIMQVSLHASNPELYKQITGRNLFNRVIRNIGTLKEKYETLISSVIYDKNFDDVQNILNLAYGLEVPIRINLVMPERKGKDVKLLNAKQVEELRSLLFMEKIKRHDVDSPLLHENNCYALAAYGIKKLGRCPVDEASKLYVDPRGEHFACEFYKIALGE